MTASMQAQEFERLRPYLLRLAYSQLGSVSEAEDVVQEAWVRLQRSPAVDIVNLRAWLTRTVGRLAMDALTSARARRETYVGPWLPEPLLGEHVAVGSDPADQVTLDESVSMALLVVLESLTPAERTAFVLHDAFGYSFNEVAEIVGRTPEATRQLAARARRAVEAHRPRRPATREDQQRIVEAFLDASSGGDLQRLVSLLFPDVRYRSDGGGAVTAARTVLEGADRVANALVAMGRHYAGTFTAAICDVNGAPGLLVDSGGEPSVVAFTIDDGRIREINVVRNPDKLRHIGLPSS